MIHLFRLLLFLLIAVPLTGCDEQINVEDLLSVENSTREGGLKVNGIQYSPDYKTMRVNTQIVGDCGPYLLSDSSSVSVKVGNKYTSFWGGRELQPTLEQVRQVGAEEIDSLGINMLILVDLTVPQYVIDRQRAAVREIRSVFPADNLYLSFIKGTQATKNVKVTDYVLNNHFVQSRDSSKYLFRIILDKIQEIMSPESEFSKANYRSLLIMSDGVVYDDDKPIDPQHFQVQQQLIELTNSLSGNRNNIYYANFPHDDVETSSANNILQLICQKTKGFYADHFNWLKIEGEMMRDFDINHTDYQFVLSNPDHKVYRGDKELLEFFCFDAKADTILTTFSIPIKLGSIYDPIIVNGDPTHHVLLVGILWHTLLFLLVFAIGQLLIPYIRYRIFMKRSVVPYRDRNMIVNGHIVGESCYLCKAPFRLGELVVAKCQHTMHLSCWNENGYHCPEYGRNCPTGSHFYNQKNLFDPANASFYLRWILAALVAALLAWISFTSFAHDLSTGIVNNFIRFIYELDPRSEEYKRDIDTYGGHLYLLPSFGLCIAFFTTLMLSAYAVYHRRISYHYGEILLRAIIAGLGGYLAFLFGCVISLTLDFSSNSFLVDWIPWTLTGYIIALCVTWRTRIPIRKKWLLGTLIVGVLSMYIWRAIYTESIIDFRVTLLLSHTLFTVGLALVLAYGCPRSERYFLRIEGPVKTMDVAIYKWINNAPNTPVSIGKSVDCNLQMTWDIGSRIAPVQAVIRFEKGALFLYAVEDGVKYLGKPLAINKGIRLFHGHRFVIGQTRFTYIEKDVKV